MQSTLVLQLKSGTRVLFTYSCNSSDITCGTWVPCVSSLLAWKRANLAKIEKVDGYLLLPGRISVEALALCWVLSWWCHRRKGRRTGLPVSRSCCVGLTPYDTSPWVSESVFHFKMLSIQFIVLVCCSQASSSVLIKTCSWSNWARFSNNVILLEEGNFFIALCENECFNVLPRPLLTKNVHCFKTERRLIWIGFKEEILVSEGG